MSEHRSLYRKVMYLVAIALLSYPVYELSHPASIDAEGTRSSGGKLAKLRDDYQLSQASLGEIDPTSQTMQLATMGWRGAAALVLWDRAHEYQKNEDWNSLAAVVQQITRLQPNFWSVWDFQGHNLSYNISVEFDDYRDRFWWVMKGIDFLKEGLKFNSTDPRFLARIGWFYGNKIGKADEHKEYRELFRKQQEEKGEKLTDNWLVSNDWYRQAQDLVDHSNRPLRVYISGEQEARRNKPGERAPSPLLFHSEAAMSLMNYAETLEEEGTFGDTAKDAWERAAAEWKKYKQRDLSTSYSYTVHLEDLEEFRKDLDELQNKLEALLPGEMEKAKQAARAKLADDERAALDKPLRERNSDEQNTASMAELKSNVTWNEVALRAPYEQRAKAREMADEIAELKQKIMTIDTYRDIVNYNYWDTRANAEQTKDCLEARDLLAQAGKLYEDGKLYEAKKAYEDSFAKWNKVLNDYPILRTNNIMADELGDEINKYKKVIGKMPNTKFPEHFVLQDLIDLNEGKKPPAAPEKTESNKESRKEAASKAAPQKEQSKTETPKAEPSKKDSKPAKPTDPKAKAA